MRKCWSRSTWIAAKWFLLPAVACLLSGCRTADRLENPAVPEFRELYQKLREETERDEPRRPEETEPRITVTAADTPLPQFLRLLSSESGASIICATALDSSTITLEMRDQPLSTVLALTARRVGADLTRKGSVYYLGTLESSDVGVLVRRAPRLPPNELREAVDVLRSPIGRSVTYDGGVLVVGDRVEVLEQIAAMLDELEAIPSVTWVVQLHVVEMSERDQAELGLDVEPALDLAVTFGAASSSVAGAVAGVSKAAELKGGLSAILKAAAESETMRVVADPLFVVADGSSASYSRGTTVPVPRRAVTEGGAVETLGWDTVAAGFNVEIAVREVGRDRLRLTLDFAADEIERFVQERPVIKGEELHAEADLVSGGVYLLGSMRREVERSTWAKLLRLGRATEAEVSLLHIYARAYRVSGGLSEEGGRERPEASGRPTSETAGAGEPAKFQAAGEGTADVSGPVLIRPE